MNKLACVCIIAFVNCASWGDTVKFGVLVLDSQTDLPVPGAVIKAGFEEDGGVWARDRYKCTFKQYVSDNKGYVRIQGTSNNGEAGATIVSAEGYYTPAHSDIPRFRKKNFFGVWQPDDLVVTVKLQRVERPIPLWVKMIGSFAHDTCREDLFAKGGGCIAFDFFVGDWLPPVGHGKVADVEFTRMPHEDLGEAENNGIKAKAYRDAVLVRFPGEDNGRREMHPLPMARLKIRTAPESGYVPNYLCWKGVGKQLQRDTNFNENRCFCFRIRTRRAADGSICEAYYGKIYGDFKIPCKSGPFVPVASVWMLYYLNPTSLDRNLEWDMKNNLCPGSRGYPYP